MKSPAKEVRHAFIVETCDVVDGVREWVPVILGFYSTVKMLRIIEDLRKTHQEIGDNTRIRRLSSADQVRSYVMAGIRLYGKRDGTPVVW